MLNLIQKLFVFMLPLIRRAALEVAADTITKAAYPDRPARRLRPEYLRYGPMTSEDLAKRRARQHDEFPAKFSDDPYHDVLMVAFDLTGPNMALVQHWLMENLPSPGTGGDLDEINLDCWWIANDQRLDGSDCDSAVFVSKGNQKAARKLLKEAGFVD